jgi:hypothetical protein
MIRVASIYVEFAAKSRQVKIEQKIIKNKPLNQHASALPAACCGLSSILCSNLFRGMVLIGGLQVFLLKIKARCPGVANDHQAWQMFALETHGTTAMGIGRLPGNMVVDAFVAINSRFLRHRSLDCLPVLIVSLKRLISLSCFRIYVKTIQCASQGGNAIP